MFRNLLAAIGVVLALSVTEAAAQDYPAKPVRMIVPYNAGGAVDYVGRVLAEHLSKKLGQNFVVENRAGASGSIGAQAVLSAPADGYTLFMTSITSNAITTAMNPANAGYDLLKDFKAAGMAGRVPMVLVAAKSVPAKTVKELEEFAKKQRHPLAYASSGVGSTEHLGAVLFAQIAGLDLLHVPYTGGAPAMADVVADRVPLMVASVPTALPQIEDGRVKPMVVALEQRIDALPDVPSAPEAGLQGFDVASVYGLLAPAGVDAAIVEKLNAAIREIAGDSDFSGALLKRGIISSSNMSGSYEDVFKKDVEKWRQLVAGSNLIAK